MFEELESKLQQEKPLQQIPINGVLDSPLFNPDGYREKLKHIDEMTDRELYNLLKDNHVTILSDLFMNNNMMYLSLITNSKFLTAMIQVMGSIPDISHDITVFCNKLAYDYLTLADVEKDSYIKQLLFALSKTVNKRVIPSLLGIGIPEDLASYLALARYSSQKEMVNVKRLNLVIMNSSQELMTEQRIVWIYEKLFNKITMLFEATMFDVYKQEELTESMDIIYSTIGLAVIDILNGMPMADIRKVLISYAGDYNALYINSGVKFSIKSLSGEYQRILDVVELLKEEQIYVP